MSRVGETDGYGGTIVMDFDYIADRIVEIVAKKYQSKQVIEVLQELQGEIDKLKGGYYPVSEFGNGADSVIQYDIGTLFYVHKIIDEKIEELSK